jgi:HEPN domain-containing protein
VNKQSAKEWLIKSYHDLKSAQILYDANHYTDSIGVDLHYSIEKSLKALLAYENHKILKTHNLPELYESVSQWIHLEDETTLYIATKYHVEISYPQYDRALPSREEIKNILTFAEKLLYDICSVLKIEIEEVIS